MPRIYLSPSTQEYNPYITGTGSEEYYMNLLADAMEPYLYSTGIEFTRNTPQMTAASSIEQGNAGDYDFYLALHSNAAPEGQSGLYRGSQAYYYPNSIKGKRAADIFVEQLKTIYPDPDKVEAVTTTYLGEVTKTKAPANLLEVAYHDNLEDAQWIIDNLQDLARVIVMGLAEYFGIPFMEPNQPKTGMVSVPNGDLFVYEKPSVIADVKGALKNGTPVTVLGSWQDWYLIQYDNILTGYVSKPYLIVY